MRHIAVLLAAFFFLGAAHAAADGGADSMAAEQPTQSSMQTEESGRWSYDEWDKNDDDHLSREEFLVGFRKSGLFDNWDFNEDGVLDAHELGEGMYITWDYDDNNYVDLDEVGGYWFREDD